ncbi:MAG: ParB N-terminal domain-containing protein, partial [Planctomycetota bacterium]
MLKVQDINLSLLKPWEDNPRSSEGAIDAVAKSVESFGFNVPILCDQEFTIIAGHTRWEAAKKIGMKSVAIADNKTAELAEWDYPKLRKVLHELKHKSINMISLGYSQAELQALLTQQRQFNWKAFEEQLKARFAPRYLLLPVKVPAEKKECLKEAIKRCADEQGVDEKDFAKVAG